jgi:alkylation response protein AidB-like acyl-CoA dehydrogenase
MEATAMATMQAEAAAFNADGFRAEVVEWIEANKEGVGGPVDAADLSREQFDRNRDFLRRAGQRGWYAPGWPVQYGGAGLEPEAVSIVREELNRRIPHLENVHPPGDIGGGVAGSLWLFGSDEQKEKFLPPVLSGDVVSWELYTEPDAGSDLQSLKSVAVRDGDHYVISGTKTFVGGHFVCDQMFVLAQTDPGGKRNENLSVFIVPSDTPGIQVTSLDMIAGSVKRTITLENVRVPVGNRIGKEGDGWPAFTTSMAGGQRFGPVGIGPMPDRDSYVLGRFFDYCRSAVRNGRRIAEEPAARHELTRLWMAARANELLRRRNESIVNSGQRLTRLSYQTAQTTLYRKLFDVEIGRVMHQVLGPLATLADPEWAPVEGEFEYFQRYAILQTHPGGTCEIQRIRVFRGLQTARPDLTTTAEA